jgi:hypothetical protein
MWKMFESDERAGDTSGTIDAGYGVIERGVESRRRRECLG